MQNGHNEKHGMHEQGALGLGFGGDECAQVAVTVRARGRRFVSVLCLCVFAPLSLYFTLFVHFVILLWLT